MSTITEIEKCQNMIKGHQEVIETHLEIIKQYQGQIKELRKEGS